MVLAASSLPAAAGAEGADAPARPKILFNRWQEDWSVLANPAVPRDPLDDLKYMALGSDAYLSLGANLRERFEANDAVSFGVPGSRPLEYVISRLEAHADARWNSLQAFVQFQSDFAPGKSRLTPVDQNRLDLEQAFLAYTAEIGGGTLRLRMGRQQIGFDLQRFISVRDGPNVRQSYDALWADYEHGGWRFISFYSQPVQNRDLRTFDDYSSNHLTYGGVHAEYKFSDQSSVTVILSQFKQDSARFVSVSGMELRNILDLRYAGNVDSFDWDLEWMGQSGHIGPESIRAWAVGLRTGYTISGAYWTPRLGFQIDAASGDSNPHDGTLGTFNPLFPNGYYLALAGFTGYTNFIHVKPSVTVKPAANLSAMLAVAAQWRETMADAVYTQPNIPVAGTAGHGGSYTGTYVQGRFDWQVTEHFSAALEAVRFQVADSIRQAGGHDGTYLGVEGKIGW
ncbi:MAG TPA: alginate export family protein [Rhizomicrobium sp.]|nr:alginate export family protein [Rhizomicrobium sp.]